MTEPRFTWDNDKGGRNQQSHGVTFGEAETAFRDVEGIRIFDPEHSGDEDRYLLLAMSTQGRLLVISHCYRADDTEIRLISARKADRDEIKQYARRKQ